MPRAVVRFAVAGAALIGLSGGVSAAEGEPHANVVEFINDTPYAVLFIYPHMDDVTDWEDDLLGNEVLEPGQRFKVNMDLGPRNCIYEITVQLATEQRLHYARFDACKETALHMTMDRLETR